LPSWGQKLASKLQSVVVVKDARTFICKEQSPICVNLRGNNGMATAGSGDVLAGIIAGLWAQRMNGFDAACVGVALHAAAGDAAAGRWGKYGLMAGDMVESLGWVSGEAGIEL